MNTKEFKRRLSAGELLVGFIQFLPSPQVSEMAGHAGFDWLWLCLEHGTTGFGTELESCIRAAEVSGILPLVRITDPAADWMYMRVLEAGAKGIIVPRVRNAADVHRALQQIKYPPAGQHGLCPWGRRFRYGADTEGLAFGYIDEANDDVLMSVIIEQKEAFENLEEILSVEGIDFAIWGPLDMMMDMGFMKDEQSFREGQKVMAEMREKMRQVCKKFGVPFDEHYGDVERARQLIAEGISIVHTTPDTLLFMEQMTSVLRPVRELAGAR